MLLSSPPLSPVLNPDGTWTDFFGHLRTDTPPAYVRSRPVESHQVEMTEMPKTLDDCIPDTQECSPGPSTFVDNLFAVEPISPPPSPDMFDAFCLPCNKIHPVDMCGTPKRKDVKKTRMSLFPRPAE